MNRRINGLSLKLLGCGLVLPILMSAPAQADTAADSANSNSPAPQISASQPQDDENAAESAEDAQLLAQSSEQSLEERLEKQQQLLERQSQLIEQQQKQIDSLKQTLEEYGKLLKQNQAAGPKGEPNAQGNQAAAQNGEPDAQNNQASAQNAEPNAQENQASAQNAEPETQEGQASAQNSETETQEGQTAAQNGEDGEFFAETEDPGPEPPSADEAPTEATAQATGQQPDLNPNISLILLGGAQAGGAKDDEHRNTLYLQEAELAITAPVDPMTRAEAYISFPRDESPEVEEAFAQYSGLGHGLQIRGGILRNEIGALNSTHTHALPQIDRPLNYTMFLGDEGLHTPGAELSWLLPLPWYSKATVSVTSRTGHHHDENHEHEGEHEGEELEELEEEEFALFPKEGKNNPILTARWENMADLNDDTTLTLGLTHASSSINSDTIRTSSLNGADLTLKWHPAEDTYKEFVWRSEYMNAQQKFQEGIEEQDKNLSGWYSYISWRINKSFRLGARYDQADSPIIEGGDVKRGSVFAEFIANEWNSLRLQYNRTSPSWKKPYNELLLQWNVVIGPHGAHKY
ncbi:hypothetical protein IJT93_01600 [bacterium]|nr:hypothetical protein [bacterium]